VGGGDCKGRPREKKNAQIQEGKGLRRPAEKGTFLVKAKKKEKDGRVKGKTLKPRIKEIEGKYPRFENQKE